MVDRYAFGAYCLERTENRNPESGIRNPESGIRNPESGIRNPESGIRNPESGFRIPESENGNGTGTRLMKIKRYFEGVPDNNCSNKTFHLHMLYLFSHCLFLFIRCKISANFSLAWMMQLGIKLVWLTSILLLPLLPFPQMVMDDTRSPFKNRYRFQIPDFMFSTSLIAWSLMCHLLDTKRIMSICPHCFFPPPSSHADRRHCKREGSIINDFPQGQGNLWGKELPSRSESFILSQLQSRESFPPY